MGQFRGEVETTQIVLDGLTDKEITRPNIDAALCACCQSVILAIAEAAAEVPDAQGYHARCAPKLRSTDAEVTVTPLVFTGGNDPKMKRVIFCQVARLSLYGTPGH